MNHFGRRTSEKILLLVTFVIAAVTVSLGGTLYVPGDAPTIQQAINLAQNGDMIIVPPAPTSRTSTF
jgi:hypothetical protein